MCPPPTSGFFSAAKIASEKINGVANRAIDVIFILSYYTKEFKLDSMDARREDLLFIVEQELRATQFIDIHTHLFMPSLGDLGLWGIDELLTYHYLEAELFRSSPVRPEQYWALPKKSQADLVWQTLFVENAPVSESTRGVVAVLDAFGLPTGAPDLTAARRFFESRDRDSHIADVLKLAGISEVVMTNDPLDLAEAPLWEKGLDRDPRFHAALRLDTFLHKGAQLNLSDWCRRIKPVYMAVSLPDTFDGN